MKTLKLTTFCLIICQLGFLTYYIFKYNKKTVEKSSLKSTSKSIEQSFDLTRIGYVVNPKCSSPLQLLTVVTTAPENSHRRDDLRNSWTRPLYESENFTVVFFVGLSANASVNDDVRAEADLMGDLVVAEFADSYRNLSLKTFLMLRWVTKFCNDTKFVLKVDDDVFVNVYRLLHFIQFADNSAIYGRLVREWQVLRNNDSKWMVTVEEFPNTVYPDYLTGPAYLIGTNIGIGEFLRVCAKQPILHLEDVFVTGVCAGKSGINRVSYDGFVNKAMVENRCELLKSIAWHRIYGVDLLRFWKYLTDSTLSEACRSEVSLVFLSFLPPLFA